MSDSAGDVVAVNLRLPAATAKRLDHYVAVRNASGKGAKISRNSAIDVLLNEALDGFEALEATEKAPGPKKAAGRR